MALPTAEQIVRFLEARPDDAISFRDIVHAFDVDADSRRELREVMQNLVENRQVTRIKAKLFQAKKKEVQIEFISKKPAREGKKTGYTLVAPSQMVGNIQRVGNKPMAIIRTQENEEYAPIMGDLQGLSLNEAAIFRRSRIKGSDAVEIVTPLGDPKAPKVEALRIALSRGFISGFSEEAEAEAKAFRAPSSDDLQGGRVDLREKAFVTIDGEDAKDFDDAVFAEKIPTGWRLFVAIADVSHYVRSGSAVDRDGYMRGTSVYFPGFVMPMLPFALSDELCSLRPNVERLAFCCEMMVTHDGKVTSEKAYKALIRSHARLTYNQVEAALHHNEDNAAKQMGQTLVTFAECSRALRRAKTERGAIDMDLPEARLVVDERGFPVGSQARERIEAHRLIEDAMLAANSAIARTMFKHHYPSAYRVHENPNETKLEVVRSMAQILGYDIPLPLAPSAGDIAAFVRELSDKPNGKLLLPYVLRCMARARYSQERLGHFALAEPDYLHFTSPIRRFPDLLVHRSLHSRGKDIPQMTQATEWLSEREQAAEKCSREVDDFYRCILAQPHEGEEFEARIVGVIEFGAFAQIDEPYIEGFIPVRTMTDDYYGLDEAGLRLWGRRSKRSLGVGDVITVRIEDVRPYSRQITFAWLAGKRTTVHEHMAPTNETHMLEQPLLTKAPTRESLEAAAEKRREARAQRDREAGRPTHKKGTFGRGSDRGSDRSGSKDPQRSGSKDPQRSGSKDKFRGPPRDRDAQNRPDRDRRDQRQRPSRDERRAQTVPKQKPASDDRTHMLRDQDTHKQRGEGERPNRPFFDRLKGDPRRDSSRSTSERNDRPRPGSSARSTSERDTSERNATDRKVTTRSEGDAAQSPLTGRDFLERARQRFGGNKAPSRPFGRKPGGKNKPGKR